MATSSITLVQVLDVLTAKGAPDPRKQPSGFNLQLPLEMGNQAMAALICERFNWKWNRAVAAPFLTNAYQQDYPQPAQSSGVIGWGEDCDIVQINATIVPKPMNWDGAVTWRRQLTRTSMTRWRPAQIAWMYNADLTWASWPGAGVTFYPLLGSTAPVGQNPPLNMVDANGNLLIVTGFGTTGASAPKAATNAAEGTTVTDGSVTWTVVSGSSQGFRLDWMAPSGQTFQIVPSYQMDPPRFTTLGQLLSPIPDSYSRHFFDLFEAAMYQASPDPAQRGKGAQMEMAKLEALAQAMRQGDREPNAYALVPATMPVETRWGWGSPITSDNPYGTR